MKAIKIADWMGQKIPCCLVHAEKIQQLGHDFGLLIKITSTRNYIHNPECDFCERIENGKGK